MPASGRCFIEARVTGSERIAVPAGTFDATKVVPNMRGTFSGSSPSLREFTCWYSPQVKRVVKITARTINAPAHFYAEDIRTDYDVVLTSFKLH